MEMENIVKHTEEGKEKHRLSHSNFDILAPKTTKLEVESNYIIRKDDDSCDLVWCAFNKSNVPKKAFDEIKLNFQKESCDLHGKDKSDVNLLLATTERDPKMKKSDRWRWIGGVAIEKGCINWCWIHPFFRREKIFTNLIFEWYIPRYGRITLQPPISFEMQKFLESMEKIVREDPKIIECVYDKFRMKLIEIGANPEAVRDLDKEKICRIMQIERGMSSFMIGKDFPKGSVDELLVLMANDFDAITESFKGMYSEEDMKKGVNFMKDVEQQVMNFGKHYMRNDEE